MNIQMADVTSPQEPIIDQPSDDPYLDILQNMFHHQNFRGIQREAIECIASEKDALVIIPTGGGKSSCYWIPGMAALRHRTSLHPRTHHRTPASFTYPSLHPGVTNLICRTLSLILH